MNFLEQKWKGGTPMGSCHGKKGEKVIALSFTDEIHDLIGKGAHGSCSDLKKMTADCLHF